jgi:hypothetical protein
MRGVTPVPGAARVAETANAGRDDAERNDGEAIASAQSGQIAATGNVIGRFHVRRTVRARKAQGLPDAVKARVPEKSNRALLTTVRECRPEW